MHRILLSVFAALATVALVGGPAAADLKVVTSVPDLAAFAKEIGAGHVSVTALSLATQDPHFVDAKPSAVLKINKADLLIVVGLDLEIGWLPTLQTAARNAKILTGGAGFLDCSQFARLQDVPTAAVDRSQGDIHPGGNPHYLYDPRQAAACATGIASKLVALDGANAALYRGNLKTFLAKLDKARVGWEKQMAPHKGKPVVTFHKSWGYVISWFGLVEVANLEPKPGIPPTPRHVVDVLKIARAKGAKVVLQEAYYPDKTGKLVAEKLGGSVVTLPGGADVGAGETYIQHMSKVVDTLAAALR